MNWANTAILSTAIHAIVNVINGHLLSTRLSGLRTFMLPVGIIQLIFSLILFFLFPLPEGVGVLPIIVAIVGALIRTIGGLNMLHFLQREDVSRVMPIVYTYPVFVAIMAVPLLGETLSYLQWLAIIIVVAGAIVVSLEKSPSASAGSLGRPFLLLFVTSLLSAVSDIFHKYALTYLSFWNVYSLSFFSLSGVFLAVALRPSTIKKLRDMKQRNSAMALIVFNETLALLAIVLAFWAMARGPISLVSTIGAARPLFVAIYSIILGFILPRFLIRRISGRVMALRLIAIAMIAGGVSIIYLT